MKARYSRVEDILEVVGPHGGVVWPADLCNSDLPGLWGTLVVSDETEAIRVLQQDLWLRLRLGPAGRKGSLGG